MALHPNFPESPHAILDPALRWFPAMDANTRELKEKDISVNSRSFAVTKGDK